MCSVRWRQEMKKNNEKYERSFFMQTKTQWLENFRCYAEKMERSLFTSQKSKKDKTSEINKLIKSYSDEKILLVQKQAISEKWDNERLLNEILKITYVSYVVMLECRNKLRAYEYMDFSRRIGEFWEPFCKLAFKYPLKKLQIIEPRNFEQVKQNIKRNATEYIDSLELSYEIKEELKKLYAIPWTLVNSGGIDLALDLHFKQGRICYNCDFKSGFHSNEKGNTNRLLLVASIYKYLGEKTLLFVREENNNNYFQTLKNSNYWEVYCAADCYAAIKSFTGFDIRAWLNNNVNWEQDISQELKTHLQANGLLKYLTW